MLLRRGVAAACAIACLLFPAAGLAASPPPPTPEPIAAKTLTCKPGQVDVNSAPASVIAARLSLPLPVAQRVIAHRQPLYLDLDDLLAVEGVGAGNLARIQRAGVACTDLPVTPPPTDEFVCRPGDGRIDLNRPSSRARLVTMFGLPTADRIVAGIPYSGVKPVVSEHVPGVGSGKQTKLLDQLCATPATIDHNNIRWGWISTAGGRVEHPKGGTLTAGAGVIDNLTGMWGSVRPVPFDSLHGGPKFDLKVHGPWQAGGSVVFATLPPDPFTPESDANAWQPTMLHYTGDDADVHAYEGVHVAASGRWSAPLRSLSEVQSISQPAVSLAPLKLFTPVPRPRPEIALAIIRDILDNDYDVDGCSPDVSHDRMRVTVDPPVLATGQLGGFVSPAAKWCAEGNPASGHVTFKLANAGMPTFGYRDGGGPADTIGVSVAPDLSPVTRILLKFYNGGVKPGHDSRNVLYGPGVTVRYNVPASTQDHQVRLFRGDGFEAAGAASDTLFLATEHLGQVPGMSVPGAVIDCIQSASATSITVESVFGCVEKLAKDGTVPRRALEGIARSLNVLALLRDLAEYTAISKLSSQFSLEADITFRLRPFVAPSPGQPSSGDPNQPGPRILKRSGSTASYVLDANGVAHHIPDGGTYICNAKHFMVQYNVDDAEWAAQVNSIGTDASCPSGLGRRLGDSSVPAGVLIRRENGKTYLTETFNGVSHLVPLFEGQAVFNCMVEKYLVWDWVTDEEYGNFDHHPSIAATGCGVTI